MQKMYSEKASEKLVSSKEFRKKGHEVVKSMDKVMFVTINLKNFKYFNQVYGVTMGDVILEELKNHFCTGFDACKLAAFTYADHISMLIEEMDIEQENKEEFIKDYCSIFTEKIYKNYPLARIHLNCGVYFVNDKDEDFEDMQDKARYARKSINDTYSDEIAVYNDELRDKSIREAGVVPMFEYAMENNTIQLYLQPKFTIDTQTMVGAEALSRIIDKDGNIISPGVYIPILEKTSLISKLDMRMIDLIIDKMTEWKNEHKKLIKVSINLSRIDFLIDGFIDEIDRKIEESGIPKEYFEFELTETVFCENLNGIIEQINIMRSHGYKISMDDFGSGYNSLYILGIVPIDVIKFDRGFVLNSLFNEKGFKIMSNLINTFCSTKFDVVCEGVETREEEELVKKTGCNVIQGFLHDRPIPASLFESKYLIA